MSDCEAAGGGHHAIINVMVDPAVKRAREEPSVYLLAGHVHRISGCSARCGLPRSTFSSPGQVRHPWIPSMHPSIKSGYPAIQLQHSIIIRHHRSVHTSRTYRSTHAVHVCTAADRPEQRVQSCQCASQHPSIPQSPVAGCPMSVRAHPRYAHAQVPAGSARANLPLASIPISEASSLSYQLHHYAGHGQASPAPAGERRKHCIASPSGRTAASDSVS
ncbi:hypothetical protein C2E23DRAFT_353232 [Lenzites betulinus]|nr:hypothetical protein C2E23DRAFT_353232 [Lenzites betulinus]